jgi:hypothetical protein
VKQTLAWISSINLGEEALGQLSGQFRILLVKEGSLSIPGFHLAPHFDVEVIDCVKEGCWEADMIVLAGEGTGAKFLDKIREVATQKIVLLLMAENEQEKERIISQIREALPFSKVVTADLQSYKALLSGENKSAVATATEVLRLVGYTVTASGAGGGHIGI